METMRAMVLEQFGEPLQLREVPVPEPGPGEVLVAVAACGLCGSDLEISEGMLKGPQVPLIMGHEPAGTVAAVGPGVSNVQVGDHVVVALYVTCGHCDYCRTNQDNLCVNLVGRPGFELDGAFAEYFKIPAQNLFPISADVPLEQVAAMSDGVATSWHAVRRQAQVQPGQTVVVLGLGGLGVHATQAARLSGARTIAMDVVPEKLNLAGRYGADVALNARDEDATAQVLELTDGRGADAVLDFVTKPDTVKMGLSMLRRGGVLVLVGLAPGKPFTADSVDVVLSEKRIVGSRTSSKQDLVDVIRLVEQGKITPVVSQHYKLE
ncbi:MAG TPA: alcohol dehydrogenase catalytic domain-containing protein, partial [Anaerolineae bacterium]|nr:alcohol dehydrogenase catalytic domain-containing protein [Anaerolineae bacterium]